MLHFQHVLNLKPLALQDILLVKLVSLVILLMKLLFKNVPYMQITNVKQVNNLFLFFISIENLMLVQVCTQNKAFFLFQHVFELTKSNLF